MNKNKVIIFANCKDIILVYPILINKNSCMKHSASIVLIFVAFSTEVVSQNIITYGYDASGNRISRSCMAAASKTSRRNARKTSDVTFLLNDCNALFSYDEKTGQLTVGNPGSGSAEFFLYNNSGAIVFRKEITGRRGTISVSHFPAGTYIACIGNGKENTYMKFTKE